MLLSEVVTPVVCWETGLATVVDGEIVEDMFVGKVRVDKILWVLPMVDRLPGTVSGEVRVKCGTQLNE